MKNHEAVMSIRESKRLVELEKLIAKGKQTFVEVGLALAEIRDLRLYKLEYGGFAEYCREKWGWSKPYCTQLITAAAVVESLPPDKVVAIATESQARELAKIPAERRAGVVQAIVDSGQTVTAAAIKRHLPPPPMVRGSQTVPTTPTAPTSGTDGAKGTNGSAVAAEPVPPPPPTQVLDATGWPIPTQLIPLWQRTGEVQEMLTALSRVKGALRTAQETKDTLYAEVLFSSALSHLDQAWQDLKTAKPFAVCPTCQGQLPDRCLSCKGRGFVSEFRWNTCVTREDKEFRVRAARATGEKGKR